jgi:dihydrofolate reductase
MKISMIAAVGANNELGYGNKLIWRIPDDTKRFHEKISGHPVIMGRNTAETLINVYKKSPLLQRENVVVTHDPNFARVGFKTATSIEEAIEIAKGEPGAEEIFIIGGAQIYALGLPHADKLYITKINSGAPMADAFFPDYSEFTKVVFREAHNDDGLEYEFLDLER